MAKILINDKGFRLIKVSAAELAQKAGGYGICDNCNEHSEEGVYVAVLNMWFCYDCFRDWYTFATRYPEDTMVEEKNYEFYRKILQVDGEEETL